MAEAQPSLFDTAAAAEGAAAAASLPEHSPYKVDFLAGLFGHWIAGSRKPNAQERATAREAAEAALDVLRAADA